MSEQTITTIHGEVKVGSRVRLYGEPATIVQIITGDDSARRDLKVTYDSAGAAWCPAQSAMIEAILEDEPVVEYPRPEVPEAVIAFASRENLKFDQVEHMQYERDASTITTTDIEQFICWGEALSLRVGVAIYNDGGYWHVSAKIDGTHTVHFIYLVEMLSDVGDEEQSMINLLLRFYIKHLPAIIQ